MNKKQNKIKSLNQIKKKVNNHLMKNNKTQSKIYKQAIFFYKTRKNFFKAKKILNKLNGHSMKNGKKQISETFFLKGIKLLQKRTYKQTNNVIKLSIFFSTPIFKIWCDKKLFRVISQKCHFF